MAGVESAGVFSIAFRDRTTASSSAATTASPTTTSATAAVTADGGKTWTLIDTPLPFRSASPGRRTGGSRSARRVPHVSPDDGETWKPLDREKYNSVAFAPSGEGWAAGPKGRIAKFGR